MDDATATLLRVMRDKDGEELDDKNPTHAAAFSMRAWAAARRLGESSPKAGGAQAARNNNKMKAWDTTYVAQAEVEEPLLFTGKSALLTQRKQPVLRFSSQSGLATIRALKPKAPMNTAVLERLRDDGYAIAEETFHPCISSSAVPSSFGAYYSRLLADTSSEHVQQWQEQQEWLARTRERAARHNVQRNGNNNSTNASATYCLTTAKEVSSPTSTPLPRDYNTDYKELRYDQRILLDELKVGDGHYRSLLRMLEEHMERVRITFNEMLQGQFVEHSFSSASP